MIRSVIETSLIDWDGKITLVVFFGACNFRCPFCHNWELLTPGRSGAIPAGAVIAKLEEKRKWIDGVVLSGGEPLAGGDAVLAFAARIKKMGFGIKLDTNGYFPGRLKKAIGRKLVDYVAMDLKARLEPRAYALATGTGAAGGAGLIRRIRRSIALLAAAKLDYEFRTTCVPGIIDETAIAAIGAAVKYCPRWALQAYRPENALDKKRFPRAYGEAELKRLLAVARDYAGSAFLRGVS